jgi:hypothetical protein
LKFHHPETVSSQGFAGVVPELDTPFQVAVLISCSTPRRVASLLYEREHQGKGNGY